MSKHDSIGDWRATIQTALQPVLEEANGLFRLPAYWFAFMIIGLLTALTGSFDTDQIADMGTRIIFLLLLMFVSAIGCAIVSGVYRALTGLSAMRRFDVVVKVGLLWVPFAAAPGRAAIAYLSDGTLTPTLILRSVMHGVAMALLVIVVLYLLKFSRDLVKGKSALGDVLAVVQPSRQTTTTVQQMPDGAVPTYIESDDHYLKIVRDCGVEFVRANLGEVADSFGSFGMRCHISYWVSRSAIDRRRRQGRQMLLVLKDGTEIPVGRSYEKAVRLSLEVFAARNASSIAERSLAMLGRHNLSGKRIKSVCESR